MPASQLTSRFGARVLAAAILVLGLGAGTALAQKELHWRSLDVAARLDADGRLHVVERHVMVFTGDWNGGERVFRTFPGQTLSLEAVRRFDPAAPSDAPRDLVRGDLSALDHYDMTDANTLRWRSRLPSQPSFDRTAIGYEIAYTLSGVLLKQGDRYVLDHNFALPAAKQPIEAFSVDLDLDPAWTPPPGFARRRTARSLVAGEDFVVHAELARAAAGAPASVRAGTTKGTRAAILAALALATLLMGVAFYRREASLGRFRDPVPPEAIDEAWLDQRLFSLLPEEAGALWDDSIGAPEVTAVLARLTADKKLETQASEKEMTMRLKAPIESFQGYEKKLIEALFFGRRTETSTSEIKAHYKSQGFNPAEKIEPGLRERLARHADFQDRSGRPPRGPTFALFLAGVALLVFDPLRGATAWGFLISAAITTGFFWGIGAIAAFRYQKRMESLGPWALSFLFVPIFFLWNWWRGLSGVGVTPLPSLIGLFLLQLAVIQNLFNVARTRSGPRKVARRKELAAARRFFERELGKRVPRMKDAWFPWIAAFGLGPSVDRWFRSFGGAAAGTAGFSGSGRGSSGSSSSGSSGDSGGGGFTGGGGFSGGGGCLGTELVRRRRGRRRRRELGRRRRRRMVSPRPSRKAITLPIRSPRPPGTTKGSLSRLWAEFTDPGPAGDTPVFLKKYAEGFGPGCMGIPFLGVGILVMVLFSHRIDPADKKTFFPLIFGGVFALAGLLVTTLGVKTIIAKSGGPAPRHGAPWTSDNDWDTAGAIPDGSEGAFRAVFGRLVFFLFIGLLNILWTVPMAAGARVIVSLVLGLFDLIALIVVYDTVRKMVQAVRVGTPRLAWSTFPSFTGGRFEAVFQTTRAMRPNGPPEVTLRRIEQRGNGASEAADDADASDDADATPQDAAGMRAYEAWSAVQTLPAFAQGTMTSFPIAMEVPADQPGTDLSKDECTYWQVAVSVPVLGPDLEAVFLVPIYERPK